MNPLQRQGRWTEDWAAAFLTVLIAVVVLTAAGPLWADGKMVAPRSFKDLPYEGSVEEQAQEAIVVFNIVEQPEGSQEDLILKITVRGEVEDFAWVVPFPSQPEVKPADAELFRELYRYVKARTAYRGSGYKSDGAKTAAEAPEAKQPVEVLWRDVVGSYDVAIVREKSAGTLNQWLEDEGYQALKDADDVLDFYRQKGYVFACIKVSDAELAEKGPVDLHPLRFSFTTGGYDGIYFPMKMTGLQEDPFDVNLYVFYGKWLNDDINHYGYVHYGFELKFRDYDSEQCQPNAGKKFYAPYRDPYLKDYAALIPKVSELLGELRPGEQYYLTNIEARRIPPAEVRRWPEDLWLFPHYSETDFVPYDAREGGPLAGVWPEMPSGVAIGSGTLPWTTVAWIGGGVAGGLVLGLLIGLWIAGRSNRNKAGATPDGPTEV